MTKEKIKQVMDACYQAKRVRDMMPKLPNGVTPTHIHYLDVITRFERSETDVKVSDISDELGLPRPGVTKTIKDMERLEFVEKKASEADGRFVYCPRSLFSDHGCITQAPSLTIHSLIIHSNYTLSSLIT